MIMMGDRKKAVAAILGPKPGEEGPESKEKEGMDSLHAAGEELMEAIHAKDVAGMLDSLKAIFEELDSPEVESEESEEHEE